MSQLYIAETLTGLSVTMALFIGVAKIAWRNSR